MKQISVEDELFADSAIQPSEPHDFSTFSRPKNVSSGAYPDGLQGKLVAKECFVGCLPRWAARQIGLRLLCANAQRRVNRKSDLNFYKFSDETDTTVVFDSLFESGNLYQGL